MTLTFTNSQPSGFSTEKIESLLAKEHSIHPECECGSLGWFDLDPISGAGLPQAPPSALPRPAR
jgi:hypothetical protein